MTDKEYMKRALKLAEQGAGHTNPNPMVGAVIVKDGRIIGEGYHERCGDLHAERNALKNCTESPEGATVYVTLEPCCHHGKQPPCVDALIEAGIRKVVVGSADPNPKVAGKGNRILREHGIEVVEDVLREECDALNEVFMHYITTGRPYVVMKYAMTMDGKIAAFTGESKWISGEESRRHAHSLRNRYAAILAGIETVLKDDPMLNCRIEGGKDPVRVICDTKLRTPLTSRVVATANEIPTIIATCVPDITRYRPYEEKGCLVMYCREDRGRVALPDLMERLGDEEIDSVLIEGGSAIHGSALEAGLVRKVYTYIAPKILGGKEAPGPVGGRGFPSPDMGVQLKMLDQRQLGEDILIESEVIRDVHRDR
ncbi:MAG: bifunctional diaminohydroxyphosphoribosylaminopyrimidine deaminase/5-amino-6-(5-phosphoribosylamino)uracil reductase RibD [Firmicutes bacterium]|nr:bifunctional diaminohydroxyphosphoribosylaminopyrimidine deaminase/5-amino-6-(5-phosphoribosylamino)uracil reductase RibD [Bacillota bacterium]